MKQLTALILPILLLSGCNKQRIFQNVEYEGFLFTKSSRQPIANASVRLEACGILFGEVDEHCNKERVHIGSAVTDANGHFRIVGKAAKMNWYFVGSGGDEFADRNGTTAEDLKSEKYDTLFLHR